jgi:hypothetical protein
VEALAAWRTPAMGLGGLEREVEASPGHGSLVPAAGLAFVPDRLVPAPWDWGAGPDRLGAPLVLVQVAAPVSVLDPAAPLVCVPGLAPEAWVDVPVGGVQAVGAAGS